MPAGILSASSARRSRTAEAVRTALAPGESWIAALVAATPFSRLEKP